MSWNVTPTADLTALIATLEADINQGIRAERERIAHTPSYRFVIDDPLDTAQMFPLLPNNFRDQLMTFVCHATPPDHPSHHMTPSQCALMRETLTTHLDHPALTMPVLVKLLRVADALVGKLHSPEQTFRNADTNTLSPIAIAGFNGLCARGQSITVLGIQRSLDAFGLDGTTLVLRSMVLEGGGLAAGWSAQRVWPFVSTHMDSIMTHHHENVDDWRCKYSLEAFFSMLSTLPAIPERYAGEVATIAFEPATRGIRSAQNILGTPADVRERAELALKNRKVLVREHVAHWLGRIGDPASLPALEMALEKEKNDKVMVALEDAVCLLQMQDANGTTKIDEPSHAQRPTLGP